MDDSRYRHLSVAQSVCQSALWYRFDGRFVCPMKPAVMVSASADFTFLCRSDFGAVVPQHLQRVLYALSLAKEQGDCPLAEIFSLFYDLAHKSGCVVGRRG